MEPDAESVRPPARPRRKSATTDAPPADAARTVLPRNQRTRTSAPSAPPEAAPAAAPPRAIRARLVQRFVSFRAALHALGLRSWQKVRGPVRVVGKLVVLAACVVGTIAVGRLIERHVRTSPAFAIRTITFAGHEQLEEAELLRTSGLAVGQNVFDLGPEDVRDRISRHPWIASVEVQRRLPGTFSIVVRERRAVAILALDQLYLVGEDGTVFKQLGEEDLVDLPVIVGIPRERFVSDRAYRASILLEIVAVMHDYRGVGLWRREPIAEVHVETDDSLSLYVGNDATYVRLGRGPFRDKLQKIRRVFDALDARDTRAAYIYADNVRRPDRVTVRLREERELVAAQ
ncbi:MAG: FtsQ-type POTRA domain-containing protein [Sandaracinaceae bacterium]|nr:FtsQ-type POTRA domain-containing protein [Sandaracinaceae bacterium]